MCSGDLAVRREEPSRPDEEQDERVVRGDGSRGDREVGDHQDMVVLGRLVRWIGGCIEVEVDAIHGRQIREEIGIQPQSNGLMSPVVLGQLDADEDCEMLARDVATKQGVVLAQAN